MSPYTVDVVSAQFPCGAAWLANALLELQVPLSHLWGFETDAEWHHHPEGESRYIAAHLPWRQTLASLRLDRTFCFRNEIRPRFTHAFPWQVHASSKLILMVRDPRDLLYSEWKRQLRNNGLLPATSFPDFAGQSFFGAPITVVDVLWLHLWSWLQVRTAAPDRVNLLRFEDWKRRPAAALAAVADYIDLPGGAARLAAAADASDLRHIKAIELEALRADPSRMQFNRLGQREEWRSTWQPDWLSAMGQHWRPLFCALGYPVPETLGVAHRHIDIDAVFNWSGAIDSNVREHWRGRFNGQGST